MQAVIIPGQDVRELIFAPIQHRTYIADLIAERAGVIAGTARFREAVGGVGASAEIHIADGQEVAVGETIATITGSPLAIARAEEVAVGCLAKPSGIATAARRAVELAGPDLKIVSGAWKKYPPEIKFLVREAVAAGGASFRIADVPFLYLDKNFVRMLGGIEATLKAVGSQEDKLKVIQIKGREADVAVEALSAAGLGAGVIMVDTGRVEDVIRVNAALTAAGMRSRVRLSFARGIALERIPELRNCGIDILDIGVAIIDAPLLDMRLEVRPEGRADGT